MNIFFLHPNPKRCARWHCDRHVVKMILETTQLLYTAHWVLAAATGTRPDFSTAPFRKGGEVRGYLPVSNALHPCAQWTYQSLVHYKWLTRLGLALCAEFKHRFGPTPHSCEAHLRWLRRNPPEAAADLGWHEPPLAMPVEFRRGRNAVRSYRVYYVESKGARGLLKYTKRHTPHWVAAA